MQPPQAPRAGPAPDGPVPYSIICSRAAVSGSTM